jgi:hypothetical protein
MDIRTSHSTTRREPYLQTVGQLPLGVAIEGSRLLVVSNNTAADSTIRPGMEILRINGRNADAIMRRLMRRVSGDGFIETGRRRRLERSFAATY